MDTIFFKDILQFQFEDYIISVNDFRLQTLTKSYPAHYHSHNSLEIHFYESGTGKMIIDDTQYDINPMSLFVTGPFVNHEQIVYTPLLKYSLYQRRPGSSYFPPSAPLPRAPPTAPQGPCASYRRTCTPRSPAWSRWRRTAGAHSGRTSGPGWSSRRSWWRSGR